MKRVFITGSEGFIGSHLTEHLVRRGYEVKACVLYNSFNSHGWLDQVPRAVKSEIEFFMGDVRDPNGMRAAVKGCDAILHLAALIAIPYSYHSPDMYVDTNIKGTLNILQAARDAGIERLVHTSTSEVYGTAHVVPMTEEHPLQGQSPYAATKIGADQLALSFYRSFGTPVAVLRPFNTYGPRQSARAVIPTIITQLAGGAKCLRLGKLSPTRDFNFVTDTVRAFEALLTAPDVEGEVYNTGSGFEISIADTASAIAELMDVKADILCEAERLRPPLSEVERLFADNAKLRLRTGWTPAYGGKEGFLRGLRETIAWFRDPAHLSLYEPQTYQL